MNPGGVFREGALDPAHEDRAWIVLLVARPRNDRTALRALLRHLRDLGARRLTAGVYLVHGNEGTGERLVALADRVSRAGGRVLLADSVVLDERERNDHDG